nr:Biomphalaria glabrata calcium/calmodulin-dependent protein kinase kinase 1-like [Biomphalaria glabrata]
MCASFVRSIRCGANRSDRTIGQIKLSELKRKLQFSVTTSVIRVHTGLLNCCFDSRAFCVLLTQWEKLSLCKRSGQPRRYGQQAFQYLILPGQGSRWVNRPRQELQVGLQELLPPSWLPVCGGHGFEAFV